MRKEKGPHYAKDSQPPVGYLQWYQWAHDMTVIHHLSQTQCPRCKLWKFPQERSDVVEQHVALTRSGKNMKRKDQVCNQCHEQVQK